MLFYQVFQIKAKNFKTVFQHPLKTLRNYFKEQHRKKEDWFYGALYLSFSH